MSPRPDRGGDAAGAIVIAIAPPGGVPCGAAM